MRLASNLSFWLCLLFISTSCASRSGLADLVIELEQEVVKTRSEATELRKRINDLEERLEKMYVETDNQSIQIKDTADKLR